MNIVVENWGLVDYGVAYQRQIQTVDHVISGQQGRLIFCEHYPVLTMGRSFNPTSLLYTRQELENRGVTLRNVDRGGDITLHAPGQLTIYVILNLNYFERDLKVYLEKLEQVAIDLLKDFGILAVSISGKRGVFVSTPQGRSPAQNDKKITSIGIGVRKWVSYHGLGINVNTDLSLFSLIKPCGLEVQMTSMSQLLGRNVDIEVVKQVWSSHFSSIFQVELI